MQAMKRVILQNGLTIIHFPMTGKSISIQATVKTGSNNEEKRQAGISHFMEHILFEGTKNRNAHQIAEEIEGIGGEIGAFTTNTRTCFYVNSLTKHANASLNVLLDILQNPLFSKKAIGKEKEIILNEIKMREDEPRFYQWQLFQKRLFKNHPAKNPIIGTRESVAKISKNDLLKYFKTWYVPNNIIITVVGGSNKIINDVQKKWKVKSKDINLKKYQEPKQKKNEEEKLIRHLQQSYVVMGYKSVPRSHPDSYVLDIIRSILGKPLSGQLYRSIRQKRGLVYNVGAHHEDELDYGYFAIYFSTHKKNIKKIVKLVCSLISKIDKVRKKELQEAKNYLEGEFVLDNEDKQTMADSLGYWEYFDNAKKAFSYVNKIKKVTLADIKKVKKKYFRYYTLVSLIQKS
jgi:predicted Zn-dependent peptidase